MADEANDESTANESGPRYWKGFDQIDADIADYDATIARMTAEIEEWQNNPEGRKPGSQPPGWARFQTGRARGRLLRLRDERMAGGHRVYTTMGFARSTRQEHHCVCGLMFISDEANGEFTTDAFYDAPGHLDWTAGEPVVMSGGVPLGLRDEADGGGWLVKVID